MQSFPRIADIPAKADLAVIALPAEGVPGGIREYAAAGVAMAIIRSSSFREVDRNAGGAVEAEIIATARGAGMRIVGPNTQGLADFLSGVVNISSMFL